MAKIGRYRLPSGEIAKFEFDDNTTPEQAQAAIQQALSASTGVTFDQGQTQDLNAKLRERLPSDVIEGQGAGFAARAGASFASDPQSKIRYYARERGLPPSRYAILNGDIVFQGDDGKLYKEESGGIGGSLGGAVGKSLPLAGGLAAGLATAPAMTTGPLGVAGAIALTGAGQAGGEALRQTIGKTLFDFPTSTGEVLKEQGFGMIGQGLGAIPTVYSNRMVAKDIGRLNPVDVSATQELLARLNQQYGSNMMLTPAEQTGLRSLSAQQKVLANRPESQDILQRFMQTQAGERQKAMGGFLDSLSPVDSPEVAGWMGREGAKTTVKGLEAQRAEAAAPFYKAAEQYAIKPTRELLTLSETPAFQAAKARALRIALNDDPNMMLRPETWNTVKGLHMIKMGLDDMINRAPVEGIGNWERQSMLQVKAKLLKFLDQATEGNYELGRGIYASASETLVDPAKEGLLRTLADTKNTRLFKTADILLNPEAAGPKALESAYSLMRAQGPKEAAAVDALNRAYLQRMFEKSGKLYASYQGSQAKQAASFAFAMESQPQAKLLDVALTPEQRVAFKDLMEIFKKTGTALDVNSDTMWKQLASEQFMREAPGPLSRVAESVATVMNPLEWRDFLVKKFSEARSSAYAEDLARIVTSPEAMSQLKSLKTMSPNEPRYWSALGELLSFGVPAGIGAAAKQKQ